MCPSMRMSVYVMYAEGLVKPVGQRQQQQQEGDPLNARQAGGYVSAAAAVVSAMSSEEFLSALLRQLDWQTLMADAQTGEGQT